MAAEVEAEIDDKRDKRSQCSHAWLVVARLAFFLAATTLMSSLSFIASRDAVDRAQYFSADVNRSGERKELSAQISAMVTEYIRNDGQVFPDRKDTENRLHEAIEQLISLHIGLAQGNESMRLLGLDKRDPKQDALMYEPGCYDTGCEGPGPDTRSFAMHVSAGLDVMIRTFTAKAKLLLARYRTLTGPRHFGLMMGDKDYTDLIFMEGYDIAVAVSRSVELIVAEADAFISKAQQEVETLFVVSIAVLVVVYALALRTIPKQLSRTARSSRELLAFFPQKVIAQTPEIRGMFEEDATTEA